MQRLLVNRIDRIKKEYKSTTFKEVISPPDYSDVKNSLEQYISISQPIAMKVVEEHTQDRVDAKLETIDINDTQALSSWIMNVILQEKLEYRTVQTSTDRWKTFNGFLAGILPIITPLIVGLLQKYLTSHDCSCSE